MADDASLAFLLKKAEELRAFAQRWPELAHELRRIADECDELADELLDNRQRGARA